MDTKNKGLADNQEGDIILNESGTSITFDKTETDESNPVHEIEKNVDGDKTPEKIDPEVGHA